MNFQVNCFLGKFNFVSHQAALAAAQMTGGTIHRILGKHKSHHITGSAI